MHLSPRDHCGRAHPFIRRAFPIDVPADQVIYWDGAVPTWRDEQAKLHRLDTNIDDLVREVGPRSCDLVLDPVHNLASNSRYIVEHTSVNPVHPLHVAALRGSLIGNGLAQLLRLCGSVVETRYFINDLGKQVGYADWAVKTADWSVVPRRYRFDEVVGVLYAVANMLEAERHADIIRMVEEHQWLPAALQLDDRNRYENAKRESRLDVLGQESTWIGRMIDCAKEDLAEVGAGIDRWERESDLGEVACNLAASLIQQNTLVTINGALCLSRDDGLIPLMRPGGKSLYFLRDRANAFARPSDRRIWHVIGNEQALLQRALAEELSAAGRSLEHISIGEVKIDGRRSSARQARLLSLRQVRGMGLNALDDLILKLLLVDRTRPLDVSPSPKAKAYGKVVRRATLLLDAGAGIAVGSPCLQSTLLNALCLRSSGLLRQGLERRQLNGIAALLVQLSQHFVDACNSGGVSETTFLMTRRVHADLKRVCGLDAS